MKISILGCGWLGCALGEALVKNGHEVLGTYRNPQRVEQITASGIVPIFWDGSISLFNHAIWRSEILIIAFPPDRNIISNRDYSDKVLAAADEFKKYRGRQVIFMSSTGIYEDRCTEVNEKARLKIRNSVAVAEYNLRKNYNRSIILRLGGLCGDSRWPGQFFAGKKNISGGGSPVNLVHRDDVVGVVLACLQQNKRGAVFNVCADMHPTRAEVYTLQCAKLGLEAPHFSDANDAAWKKVSNEKIKQVLGYRFVYPDPMTF